MAKNPEEEAVSTQRTTFDQIGIMRQGAHLENASFCGTGIFAEEKPKWQTSPDPDKFAE